MNSLKVKPPFETKAQDQIQGMLKQPDIINEDKSFFGVVVCQHFAWHFDTFNT